MTMTKKIWIIEADNSDYWSEPIIKYSAKEAKDYVRKEYEDVLEHLSQYRDNTLSNYWEIKNRTGTASISNCYGDYYNWRITEHEIEFDSAE